MKFVQAKQFSKKVGWGVLATSDGRKVGSRPMSGFAWFGKELWCATAKASDKVKQLKKVSNAEYCFTKPSGEHLRIAGRCRVSANNNDKLKLYKELPLLKKYIEDPKDPAYVVIKMKPNRIRWTKSTDLDYKEIKVK